MRNFGLVSIITPLYNCEQYISATIESVLKQSYQNWEMIIVDDKSIDNSVEKAKIYASKDSRIKVIELNKNSGPAIARNKAIKEARGKYIAFLDSDDLWLPAKLEKQLEFMVENNINFSFTAYKRIDESGNDRGIVHIPQSVTYDELLKTNVIGCLTAIYNAEKLGKVYMPNILKRQDYAVWLEILKKERQARGLNVPLAVYRIRNNSVSSNKFEAALYHWKIYREIEQLSLFKSIYNFINYLYYGLKKHSK